MISIKSIISEVDKSKLQHRTTSFLLQFVFLIIEKSLKSAFGQNYSDKCLQSSYGINHLLNKIGIESDIYKCELKALEVYELDGEIKFCWGGFSDESYHVFLMTQFSEIVDFTFSLLYKDPNLINKNVYKTHPIWWCSDSNIPDYIQYKNFTKLNIEDSFKQSATDFIDLLDKQFKDTIHNHGEKDIEYYPILINEKTINELIKQKDPWLFNIAKSLK